MGLDSTLRWAWIWTDTAWRLATEKRLHSYGGSLNWEDRLIGHALHDWPATKAIADKQYNCSSRNDRNSTRRRIERHTPRSNAITYG